MDEEVEIHWWVEGGSETCPHCFQRYAYETEYRCACCDGPVCPMCFQEARERSRIVCPGCADSEEKE